jgi:hypothetical protein
VCKNKEKKARKEKRGRKTLKRNLTQILSQRSDGKFENFIIQVEQRDKSVKQQQCSVSAEQKFIHS